MTTDELLQRWSDGSITAEELRELTAKLAAPEHQRALLDDWLLESSLPDRLPGASVASLADAPQTLRLLKVSEPPRTGKWIGWPFWRPLAAAAVLFATLIGMTMFFSANAKASSAKLLKRAIAAHSATADRCYRVEVLYSDGHAQSKGGAQRLPEQEIKLWTRGDRFWVEMRLQGRVTAWGRDERGRVWLAHPPELGAFLEPDEVDEHLALSSQLRQLRLESLIRTLLADFDLYGQDAGANRQLIHAELKAGRMKSSCRSAVLEVDTDSAVLRRLVLTGINGGPASISLIYIESNPHDAANYTLDGHLPSQAMIYDRYHQPDKRDALFARLFSPLVPASKDKP